MTDLTRNAVPFKWGRPQQEAFQTLKDRLTMAPLLLLPNDDLPFTAMTDASDLAIGVVLMQDRGHGLHPVEYLSRRLNDTETRYHTYDKEIVTGRQGFKGSAVDVNANQRMKSQIE